MNGQNTRGIELTISNTQTGIDYVLQSGSKGYFFSGKIPPGNYVIKKLFYKNESGNSWASLWINITAGTAIKDKSRFFTVSANRVNNLGLIDWDADKTSGKTITVITVNSGYESIKTWFGEFDKKSKWSAVELINTGFTAK